MRAITLNVSINLIIFFIIGVLASFSQAKTLDEFLHEPIWLQGETVNIIEAYNGKSIFISTDKALYYSDDIFGSLVELSLPNSKFSPKEITKLDVDYRKGEAWLIFNNNNSDSKCLYISNFKECNGKYRPKIIENYCENKSLGGLVDFDVEKNARIERVVLSVFKGNSYVCSKGENEVPLLNMNNLSWARGGVSINRNYAFSATLEGLSIYDLNKKVAFFYESDSIIRSIASTEKYLMIAYGRNGVYRLDISELTKGI